MHEHEAEVRKFHVQSSADNWDAKKRGETNE